MRMATDRRVLVVVFDALRPEFVTPSLMPNLSSFARENTQYSDSHATFPTETRVNQSAVTTGCMPRGHGIVGNKFVARELGELAVLNTGEDRELAPALPRLSSGLLGVPTLSELLAANGLKYASLSTGTSGGGRLINPKAGASGSLRVALRRPEASVPSGVFDIIASAIGPLPPYALPATPWIDWGVSAYLEFIEVEVSPDVMVLWLCEPDETFHKLGIGSPESLTTIKHVDQAFGRILEHHATSFAAGTLQIIAMSDHGQITLAGPPLDLPARLTEAGFSAMPDDASATCRVVIDNAGGIWLRSDGGSARSELVAWLREQPWCGPLFTAEGVDGTLRQAEIGLDHPRAPDVSVVLRADDAPNAWGIVGSTVHDAPYPVGGGCHGGLSRHELHNVLTLGGSAFRSGTVIDTPAGNVDITPTVLDVLGLDVPANVDGRVLREALKGSDANVCQPEVTRNRTVSKNPAGRRTVLETATVGQTRYLHAAYTE